jgi:hypothetical protein
VSTVRETRVPSALAALLAPAAPLTEGLTLLLVTISADGYPHIAMLSCGEVIATAADRLSMALWPASTAAANLAVRPKAALSAVADSASWTLSLAVAGTGAVTTPLNGTLRRFDARLAKVTSDQAPYATLESGVTFRLKDPGTATARWQQLRTALAGGTPGG